MSWRVRLAFLLTCAAIMPGCSEHESTEQECERLRDHLVDVRYADGRVTNPESHRAALKAVLDESFVDRCVTSFSDERRRCALQATDHDAVTACAKVASK